MQSREEPLVHTNFRGNSYGPIIGPYLYLGKFVWTNGPESSSQVRERKMRTNFFCTNFLNTPRVRDIPAKFPGHPRFISSKPKEDKLSRESTNFSATTPSRGRPPPHRAVSGPKKLIFVLFFLAWQVSPYTGIGPWMALPSKTLTERISLIFEVKTSLSFEPQMSQPLQAPSLKRPESPFLSLRGHSSGVTPANQTKERPVHELFAGAFRNKSSRCESCLFSYGKTPEFTKMGEIHELFVLALSLVWFAGATPEFMRLREHFP